MAVSALTCAAAAAINTRVNPHACRRPAVHTDLLSHLSFCLTFLPLFLSSPIPVPTIAPGNVQAEAVNSTAIRFTWTAPNPQFINGINQGYKVSSGCRGAITTGQQLP